MCKGEYTSIANGRSPLDENGNGNGGSNDNETAGGRLQFQGMQQEQEQEQEQERSQLQLQSQWQSPETFRKAVRDKKFHGPTNGVCPGYIQCNLVVLKEKDAFDFLLFCQRNKQACPLIEVLDVGSHSPSQSCGNNASESGSASLSPDDTCMVDLRTDIPKYRIYEHGKLVEETSDVTNHWPVDSVAFLIGCSFTTDDALIKAGIRLRAVEQQQNVPMYKTNIPCTSAGSLSGTMVVSMKPIKAVDIAKEVLITSKFPHAHGAPVCVGCPASIGIKNIMEPDYGDVIEVKEDELPVFHACGVTPQNIILESQVPFAITHAPGHMLVTDLLADKPV